MTKEAKVYMRDVRRRLHCVGFTRKSLLLQFSAMINTYLEDCENPTIEDLNSAFGSPEEMATQLMKDVPPKEYQRYITIRNWGCGLAAVFAIMFFVFSVYTFIWKEVNVIDVEGVLISGKESVSQIEVKK